MPHSRELIESITEKVEDDYPRSAGYEYKFEQCLPGTRMFPDVLVTLNGQNICAVEIGYTRPEKLTAYRNQFEIPDVRWYDKAGHLHGDVQEKSVTVKISAEPQSALSIYTVAHCEMPCPDCLKDTQEGSASETVIDRYIRRFGAEEWFDVRMDNALEHAAIDTLIYAMTDGIKIWFPAFCDQCGLNWFLDPEDQDDGLGMWLMEEFRNMTPRERGKHYGPRSVKSWQDACKWLQEEHGLSLEWYSGDFLNPNYTNEQIQILAQLHGTTV